MASTVYFTDMSATWKKSVADKTADLFNKMSPADLFHAKELIAVKLHFGESGNTGFIKPQFVRRIVDGLKVLGAKPFLTDTNTLYVGSRAEACSHLITAFDNGFTREITGAPVMIADGLRGSTRIDIPMSGQHVRTAKIASDIANADGMVVLSHFKGHELSGFGGTLKNVGMGCAAREGKLEQHSNISPKVDARKCVGCGECEEWCRGGAISIQDVEGRPQSVINPENCVGCAECILTCPEGAIKIRWNESVPVFMEKMVEYAAAVINDKQGKICYMTFVSAVSPLCDCTPFSDRSIVPDVGILASMDPVAIDTAAVDLVNAAPGNRDSGLEGAFEPGEDKFRALFPNIDWTHQLEYAESLGLGTRAYELVTI